jgi:cytochrome c oxidase cbb3-type subunit 3
MSKPAENVSLPGNILRIALLAAAGLAHAGAALAEDAGEDIYRYYCYQCHGYAGDAQTLATASLEPPPRDFTSVTTEELPVERIVATVLGGREGTAMVSFASVLDEEDARSVAEYIQRSFMQPERVDARYHSPENGWTDHERYAAAFPFIDGRMPLSVPWESLTADQQRGRRLYESACVSCHDQPNTGAGGDTEWELRAVSFPRDHFSHRESKPDFVSGASPYAQHDVPPDPAGLSELALAGRLLYQDNCAFCHAADGTGRNWIGSFLEPRPRDFTDPDFRLLADTVAMEQRVLHGIPGTSMPAWRDVLESGEIAAIIAYIRESFQSASVAPANAP